ncbi:Tol-Pal system beta propeller repeat protein TolB [Halioglobus japonicus]|uniref:Tol-Pal system beta propeller repeat protein TolB n=1 Tax=Halioglobus japonicus TaxID=930805 RepID=UPI00097943BC|nr:Tol-Pal system beta propeller repeat protein TolB [Halioglobus japonicus]AQA19992.1 Tol-Pal system beta propeller repeat protein TolB [Halioglobus japonicus]GHD22821.1 protein TolB [Halioglobus japonicus]
MKRLVLALAPVLLALMALNARAQLTIEITQGVDDPTAIAVVPFAWAGPGPAPEDIAWVVDSDLARSGQFAPVGRAEMLGRPSTERDIFYRDWRALDTEYILIGRSSASGQDLRVEYELYDVTRQARVYQGVETGPINEARMIAHRVADDVYEKLTGIRGAFATRLLYVSVTRVEGGKDYYRLTLADSDGARPIVLLESREPIMAPGWSPDGSEISYVSFETGRPAIYRQNLSSGAREQLTNFKGLNGAPAWSPDGRSMAMVLSKDGSPDIYLLDLATKQLTRLTRHYAIDTEPTWTPDGRTLLFTSDRGGRPQIYKYDMRTGNTERLTYEGVYNARARVAQDGRNVVMVHQVNGRFHIAIHDLVTNRLQVLTSTELDESPSIAPNGSMVLYATKHAGRGILAAVSVDGGVKFRLPSREGDVREPAWSPYMER